MKYTKHLMGILFALSCTFEADAKWELHEKGNHDWELGDAYHGRKFMDRMHAQVAEGLVLELQFDDKGTPIIKIKEELVETWEKSAYQRYLVNTYTYTDSPWPGDADDQRFLSKVNGQYVKFIAHPLKYWANTYPETEKGMSFLVEQFMNTDGVFIEKYERFGKLSTKNFAKTFRLAKKNAEEKRKLLQEEYKRFLEDLEAQENAF